MVLIKSKYDGVCSQCKQPFKKDSEVAYEKGKPILCQKCAPEGTKKAAFGGRPPVNPWDGYFEALMNGYRPGSKFTKSDVVADIDRAARVADLMLAERNKRGFK